MTPSAAYSVTSNLGKRMLIDVVNHCSPMDANNDHDDSLEVASKKIKTVHVADPTAANDDDWDSPRDVSDLDIGCPFPHSLGGMVSPCPDIDDAWLLELPAMF
ncbi:unnamed protein product [Aphanomyces euteiches]